ncbi:MAG: MFS transporter, partial [Gimesia chilikensis]
MAMPLIFSMFVGILGFSDTMGWRASMFLAGLVCALTGIAYYFLTQDAPDGNFKELREAGKMPQKAQQKGQFLSVCKDHRVWALFVIYCACFGIELTINNVAALYFQDYFDYFKNMDTTKAVKTAGLMAGMFGLMNIFARTLGGI